MSTRPTNEKSAEPVTRAQRAANDPRHGKLLTSARIEADVASFEQSGGRIEVLGVPSNGKTPAAHSAPARARTTRRGNVS